MSAGSAGGRPSGLMAAILKGLAPRGAPLPAPQAAREPDGPGYETEDVKVGNTARVMAGLALAALCVVGLMIWMMAHFAAGQRAALPALTPQQTGRLEPPPPNLQADPYADIGRARAAARARLSGYGYLDAARTRARIPIDRAMQLTVGRSLDPAESAPGIADAPAETAPATGER